MKVEDGCVVALRESMREAKRAAARRPTAGDEERNMRTTLFL